MRTKINRDELVSRLDLIEYKPGEDDEELQLEQMSLGAVLLALADVNHEREYELCRQVAVHLLGDVYEPDDIILETEPAADAPSE